jgi:F-type H+-transporting ATPase subunit delta
MIIKQQAKREAKQLFRSCLVDGALDENRIRQVAEQVAAAGHRGGAAVIAHLLRLVRLDRERHTASVESAAPLGADLQAAIRASLTQRYGPGLAMAFVDRPSLIGGVRIQVGCDVYDGSVSAELAALERSF